MISPSKTSTRYAIVVADFYRDIADALLAGAEAALAEAGVVREQITCVRVPGAFEIPHACARLVRREYYSVIITLGAVVRGETPHFDYVAGECARGVMELNLLGKTPVIFGVLTTDTMEQARARADTDKGDKGGAAARAAMAVAKLPNPAPR
ncbi:MAG: 6,7-dimethyl-8-ribityllumazine synthase [Gammaproteobacteria bacterium]|nr:6,7-dimethyl-8-ribityllumazine synthase [Gammaproteobacteria bacterium]